MGETLIYLGEDLTKRISDLDYRTRQVAKAHNWFTKTLNEIILVKTLINTRAVRINNMGDLDELVESWTRRRNQRNYSNRTPAAPPVNQPQPEPANVPAVNTQPINLSLARPQTNIPINLSYAQSQQVNAPNNSLSARHQVTASNNLTSTNTQQVNAFSQNVPLWQSTYQRQPQQAASPRNNFLNAQSQLPNAVNTMQHNQSQFHQTNAFQGDLSFTAAQCGPNYHVSTNMPSLRGDGLLQARATGDGLLPTPSIPPGYTSVLVPQLIPVSANHNLPGPANTSVVPSFQVPSTSGNNEPLGYAYHGARPKHASAISGIENSDSKEEADPWSLPPSNDKANSDPWASNNPDPNADPWTTGDGNSNLVVVDTALASSSSTTVINKPLQDLIQMDQSLSEPGNELFLTANEATSNTPPVPARRS